MEPRFTATDLRAAAWRSNLCELGVSVETLTRAELEVGLAASWELG